MTKMKLYDNFILCSSDNRFDVYSREGGYYGRQDSVTAESGIFAESRKPIDVDYEAYIRSVQDVLGSDMTCITHAAHHSHASSVGHSNMVVVARQLVLDASEEDAQSLFLADSIASGCRVQGWFMNAKALSEPFMDRFLDRYKWLSRGWPLANDHHAQVLAYRIATLRPMYLLDILMQVADVANLGEHKSMVSMRFQNAKLDLIIELSAKIMEGMEKAILFPGNNGLETLDEDVIRHHAPRIADVYKSVFSIK